MALEGNNQQNIVAGRKSVLEYLSQARDKVDLVWLQQGKEKELRAAIELCRAQGLKFQIVEKQVLDRLAGQLRHQGLLARIFQSGFVSPEQICLRLQHSPLPIILALDQVQDSGNLGVLARTLLAMGGAGLVLPKNRTAFPGLRAEKSAAGALSKLPIARITNLARFLEYCQAEKISAYYAGTDISCENLFELEFVWPAVLVLGNEEKGVRPGLKNKCLSGVQIPMPGGFESLNVAQAGAVILGELLRRSLSRGKPCK